MKENREVISVLDELVETLKDGQEGFKKAAEGVSDPKLKSLFLDYSNQRSRFATALQAEARKFGEKEPDDESSASGALIGAHRRGRPCDSRRMRTRRRFGCRSISKGDGGRFACRIAGNCFASVR